MQRHITNQNPNLKTGGPICPSPPAQKSAPFVDQPALPIDSPLSFTGINEYDLKLALYRIHYFVRK